MDVHQNARLTVHCRELLVERILQGRPKAQAARELGVSETTMRKWLKRYRAEGMAGLRDRSSRPHYSPRATAAELQRAVLALRQQRLSQAEIAARLGLSHSTVGRICARGGLRRLSQLEPAPPVHRYERAAPGELLHLDTKKLGRIARIGYRITGDRHDTVRRVGWDLVHVAIDDCSRVGFTQILPDEEGGNTALFLRLAVSYLRGTRNRHPRSAYGQRLWLPQWRLRRRLSRPRHQTSLHAALHPPHQRQGGAVHSVGAARMGVCARLRQLSPASPCSASLDARL